MQPYNLPSASAPLSLDASQGLLLCSWCMRRLQDLQIHGNEPCPLFDLNDPFWDRYGKSPLSPQFVPQQDDFILRSPNEVLLLHWKFNKTAWVQNSQGPHGVVKAVGDGYWLWEDVLVTWSRAPAGAPKGGALAAAIVVPIVVVALLAAAGAGFVLWRRCGAVLYPSPTGFEHYQHVECIVCCSAVVLAWRQMGGATPSVLVSAAAGYRLRVELLQPSLVATSNSCEGCPAVLQATVLVSLVSTQRSCCQYQPTLPYYHPQYTLAACFLLLQAPRACSSWCLWREQGLLPCCREVHACW
jgi:hypothetical protein